MENNDKETRKVNIWRLSFSFTVGLVLVCTILYNINELAELDYICYSYMLVYIFYNLFGSFSGE